MNHSSLHTNGNAKYVSTSQFNSNCKQVKKANSSLELCLESASKLNNIRLSKSHRVFQGKESLFYAGEEFEGLYILRSGSAKSFITSLDGEEHITKFYYPGDLLGVDGFDEHRYMENVVFLETSSVCLVKENDLSNLVKSCDDFRNCLFRAISHAFVCDSAMMMCLSNCSSERKVARFIIEVSEKFRALGLSGTDLRLSMTRTDIANYMGMAIETVSRVLTSFQDRMLIQIQNRRLTILDYNSLSGIVAQDSKQINTFNTIKMDRSVGAVY